ncbi:MAG: TRAP transporter large permease [Pseudomonadota bacterium]|nr:TRAP transporter large permease [Pseudomonadota bacterium]
MIGFWLFVAIIGLLAIGVPVTFALATAGALGIYLAGFLDNPAIVTQQLLTGINKPALMAIPFFIFAGSVMTGTGLSSRIFSAAHSVVGHLRGGLAQVNVVSSFMFAGISGSSVADIAGIGRLSVTEMVRRGYPLPFSAGLTVVTSILGPLVPPSITLIIYAWLANESVARMFLAGAVPGVLLGLCFMIYVAYVSIRRGYPTEARQSIAIILKTLLTSLPALLVPVFILLAMVFGIATATEAGVLASAYAIVLGLFYKTVNWAMLRDALVETILVTSLVMMIIGFSQVLNWTLSIEQIPQALADLVFQYVQSRGAFMIVLIVFLLIVGCFLDVTAAMILLVPLLLPLADQYDIDRIQFGIVLSLSLLAGIATPPMGIGLYVMCGLKKIRLETLSLAVLPMLIPVVVALLVIAFVPQVTMLLPDLVMPTNR